MACFLVPTAAALVATAVKGKVPEKGGSVSWRTKFTWLLTMMWGGALLLALEHIWHGEVVFAPPFLTAMASAEQTSVMLQEVGTVGVGMAVIVLLAWAAMVLVADHVPAVRAALTKSAP
ncbi:MAG: hypothetical protein LBR58_02470 [Propionibacteriaceae bacterium]|jgi:hypothetical protein|nr:hypothetical protein [Propionibacteriaceae bacterium]